MEENKPGEIPRTKNPLPTVHTYQSDVADSLKSKDVSLIDIALSEHQKKESSPIVEEKKNYFLLPISLILLGGAVIALMIVFLVQSRLNTPVTPAQTRTDIIITDAKRDIPYAPGENLGSLLQTGIASLGTTNTMTHFSVYESTTTAQRITIPIQEILQSTLVPSYLARSLAPTYMLGVHSINGTSTPFIILKTTSFETALAGMINWEMTLTQDFQSLFGIAATSSIAQTGNFQTVVLRNIDVKVVKNKRGQPILYYSVPDKDTIVITSTEETFNEIMSRLATSQFVQ
jgi:hypothetical protein